MSKAKKQSKVPEISIVIPVYNEEGILSASLSDLIRTLGQETYAYEIIVAENGSTDRTVEIAESFAADHEQIRFFSIGEPNYGKALREGIRVARGEFVICDEIDLCDVTFYKEAIPHLRDGCDLVVGSKRAPGARDRRPAYRRLATQVLKACYAFLWVLRGPIPMVQVFCREALLPSSMPASWTKTCLPASSLFEHTGRATLGWKSHDLVEK